MKFKSSILPLHLVSESRVLDVRHVRERVGMRDTRGLLALAIMVHRVGSSLGRRNNCLGFGLNFIPANEKKTHDHQKDVE